MSETKRFCTRTLKIDMIYDSDAILSVGMEPIFRQCNDNGITCQKRTAKSITQFKAQFYILHIQKIQVLKRAVSPFDWTAQLINYHHDSKNMLLVKLLSTYSKYTVFIFFDDFYLIFSISVQNYAMLCATIKSEASMQAKASRFL